MYKKADEYQLKLEDFVLPFGGKLNPKNRWIIKSKEIPWSKIEEKYSELFSGSGAPAKNVRIALGALLIKEQLCLSDRETVNQIQENPYLQYFLGMKYFEMEKPLFDSSSMVHFRKRFPLEVLQEINEMIIANHFDDENNDEGSESEEVKEDQGIVLEEELSNKGKLKVDATCAPSDIKYPTDINLLNEAREKSEKLIDYLYSKLSNLKKKPRTYRRIARKEYLKLAKQRKAKQRAIRKGIRKQLQYLRRDIKIINTLLDEFTEMVFCHVQLKEFWVIQELFRQQQEMYKEKKHSIDNRIVSISQPHVRPIVRGKRNSATEFGAKISASLIDGYARIEKLSWDNFNEGITLPEILESYKERYGYYPESVLADRLYQTRENRKYCKSRGIRLSGPKLGRKSKDRKIEELKEQQQDAKERNAIEGKFGEGKRSYGLGRIIAKLRETSETVIMLQFINMNLEHKLRVLFSKILDILFKFINILQENQTKEIAC